MPARRLQSRLAGIAENGRRRRPIWNARALHYLIERFSVYLLSRPDALFGEVPPDNPYLRLVDEAPKRENLTVKFDNSTMNRDR